MYYDLIVWDDEDDPGGNYQHITGPGEVTAEDVEDVIAAHRGPVSQSDRTGLPLIFGTTAGGQRIAVVFRVEPDPALVIIKPVTAFPVED